MNKVAFISSEADVAVSLRGLRKVYKLYRSPAYRLRDILGLLPADKRYYDDHVALHDVTVDIRRGEKVAIIGRNGAGKSTLLRLITKVIEPTSGTIEVKGETQALLSLGTGFHPEFTGRQNVEAYLANFGITGAKAERMIREVIDFAELEEYIDQPTKTYSTGMNMRLMFAASTMFVPDLLVIDEVLGVGDAYFQAKSFERIREICNTKGSTLLLVTHDIYTASTLCERMIWIDRGVIMLDAESPTVLKAYDASIRQQEEARLHKKAMLNLQRAVQDTGERLVPLMIELRSPTNTPAAVPVQVSRVALVVGETEVASAALTGGVENVRAAGRIVTEVGIWGEVTTWNNRLGRQMNNFGSSLHKAGVAFLLPESIGNRADALTLEVEAGANDVYRLEAWRIDADLKSRPLGTLPCKPGEWTTFRASLSGNGAAAAVGSAEHAASMVRAAELHGSGRVIITDLRCLDGGGRETLQLEHGKPASIVLDFEIRDPTLHECCQVMIAFRRNGVDDMLRLFGRELLFDGRTRKNGQIVAFLPRFPLGVGEYGIAILLAGENYYEENPTMFYTINPKVYWAGRNIVHIKVTSDHIIPRGTGVVGEAAWSIP
jgi:ABC-type polysaccharide/polyol phosphate transport system ATPase subunit